MAKLNKEEKEILKSYESGEWRRVQDFKGEFRRYQTYARSTLQKNKRVNIRLSSKDLEEMRKKAFQEGIPYQTLMSSVIHKYVLGSLKERAA